MRVKAFSLPSSFCRDHTWCTNNVDERLDSYLQHFFLNYLPVLILDHIAEIILAQNISRDNSIKNHLIIAFQVRKFLSIVKSLYHIFLQPVAQWYYLKIRAITLVIRIKAVAEVGLGLQAS